MTFNEQCVSAQPPNPAYWTARVTDLTLSQGENLDSNLKQVPANVVVHANPHFASSVFLHKI